MNDELTEKMKRIQRLAKHNSILFFFCLALIITGTGVALRMMTFTQTVAEKPIPYDSFTDDESYSSLEIQGLSDPFASYQGNSSHQIYFAFDKLGYPYILVMTDEQFGAMKDVYDFTYDDSDVQAPEPMAIAGYPVAFDDEMRTIAIEEFASFIGDDTVTEANFEDWFGYTYLDATKQPDNPFLSLSNIITAVGLILLVISLIGMLFWVKRRRVTERTMTRPEISSWLSDAARQLEQPDTTHLPKIGLYLTRDYIVSYQSGFDLLRFDRISGVSQGESGNRVVVDTKDGISHDLADTPVSNPVVKESRELLTHTIRQKLETSFQAESATTMEGVLDSQPTVIEGGITQMMPVTKGNPLLGLIGAFVASLIGVAAWIIIGKIGFIAGIAGYLIMIMALKGYEALAGKPGKSGGFICLFVTVIMIFVANWLGYYIEFYSVLGGGHATLLSIWQDMPTMMEDFDLWGSFFMDLAIGYGLSLWSCFSYIKALLK